MRSTIIVIVYSWAAQPLHWHVWLVLLLLTLTVAATLTLFSHAQQHLSTLLQSLDPNKRVTSSQQPDNHLGLNASLWLALGAFLQQGLWRALLSQLVTIRVARKQVCVSLFGARHQEVRLNSEWARTAG